jgi:hypothetical protein
LTAGFLAALATLGLSAPATCAAAASAPFASLADQARGLVGSWNCQTTRAGGLVEAEQDRIEPIGNGLWLHGTARSATGAGEPFYDFYVGYADARWVFIQIYPAAKFYFVGISDSAALSPSSWQIVYPTRQDQYQFRLTPDSFTISYPDLTQFCQRASTDPGMTPPSTRSTLSCSSWYWGNGHSGAVPLTESLTISRPQDGVAWWQGVARNASTGEVVYAYNLFDLPGKRISVLVNATSGAYAVADGSPSKDLNGSVWMVAYPRVQSGFAFNGVGYSTTPGQQDLPTALTLIFKDGYQRCSAQQQ